MRANICNAFVIAEVDKTNIINKFNAVGIVLDEITEKAILKIIDNGCMSLFEILENSTLFLPLSLLAQMDVAMVEGFISDYTSIWTNSMAIVELRNTVAHNRFLLNNTFGKKPIYGRNETSVWKYIDAFKQFLPIEYLNGHVDHKGFAAELKVLSVGLDESVIAKMC